jgi:PAS domain-containing protein
MNTEEYISDAQLLRIKAEEALKTKQYKVNSADTEHDAKRLLHELQVHQIELEMQNEELRESNAATELALKRYTMLYDLAPMGFFTLKSDGTIEELNFMAAEMLGERRFSLINTNFKLFVSDESKGVFNEFFRNVLMNIHKQTCHVQLGYDNHPLGYVYMEGVFVADEKKCLLSILEINGSSKMR